jgi:hypothetical protein
MCQIVSIYAYITSYLELILSTKILEVSTLKDHLKTDCEKKHLVKQCTQCQQSIPVEQWKKHTLKKICTG